MSISQKECWKIANTIRNQLLNFKNNKQRDVQNRINGLIEQMDKFVTIRRKLDLCVIRKWQAARKKVLRQIVSALQDIPFHTQQVQQSVNASTMNMPSVSDIYRELIQTQEEFGELNYYKESDLLAVTTEPIELDYVYLGEFEIQLHLPSLAAMEYNNIYRIFAVDPHPAGGNSSVTHPHVSDERLCAGDAGAAINLSLKTGRICDFFLLVLSVLNNYNPESPYVSLENWSGTACYDCGCVASGDNVFWCEQCQNDFCSDCSSYCRNCDDSACLGCLTECRICSELICSHCMTTCPDCGEELCQNCLENMECQCTENNEENENEFFNEENETKCENSSSINLDDAERSAAVDIEAA